MLDYGTIKRNNGNSLPFFVDPQDHFSGGHSIDTEDEGDTDLHVDMKAFEEKLDAFFGLKLSDVPKDIDQKTLDLCKTFIREYSDYYLTDYFLSSFRDVCFEDVSKPSAILYENTTEMFESVFVMYQLSYAHYILGKHYGMKGYFPDHCCGVSSRNLVAAFWDAGIVSAVRVSTIHDHAYVIVPFVVQQGGISGVVLVDPTSDQLINTKTEKVRNLVRIIVNKDWSYITDWAGGANLQPNSVENSVCHGSMVAKYTTYIESAYENPVVVV